MRISFGRGTAEVRSTGIAVDQGRQKRRIGAGLKAISTYVRQDQK